MNISLISAVCLKDWKEILKSSQAVITIVVVPLVLIIILPAIFLLLPTSTMLNTLTTGDLDVFLSQIPAHLIPQGFTDSQTLIYAVLVYFFAPLFLLLPVMVASVIASSSFAGEKERKTIEGLLYTPISDQELVLAKILVALIPAIGISVICFVAYGFLVNGLGYRIFHTIFFPTMSWIVMMVLLVPGLSFLSLGLVVAVSQRAAGMWEAQQISVVVLLPVIALIISQAAGLFYISVTMIVLAGVAFLAIDYVFYQWIVRTFNRERMVSRLT